MNSKRIPMALNSRALSHWWVRGSELGRGVIIAIRVVFFPSVQGLVGERRPATEDITGNPHRPIQSARGLAHSKSFAILQSARTSARFWSAAVLCRFRFDAVGDLENLRARPTCSLS